MNMTQWLIFFLLIQVIHFLGTWKLYIKAGRKAWEALIPIYNAIILMKIIKRPTWWVILLFLPIINLIMFPVVWVETIRSFGKNTRLDTWLVVLTLGFYIYYINYFLDVKYITDRSLSPKSGAGEWISSILFAVVAATLVHTYFMQPFVIPSSSLEKTLLVGDFLFVSKFHYGARVPMTTVALPMVHDTIPLLKTKSYLFNDDYEKRKSSLLNKLQLPYMRLPGFQKIKRNDIVVFNQPADTLLDMNLFTPDRNYYKPIDKKTNLVKRCVAIPGDSLQIIDGKIYINGKPTVLPDRAKPQYSYKATLQGRGINQRDLLRLDITDQVGMVHKDTVYFSAVSDEAADRLKNNPNIAWLERNIEPKGVDSNTFPHDKRYPWNTDQFGPIYIPEAGKTVNLDVEVLPLYKRIITEYESNELKVNGNQISINGKPANTYTFKQDYYWMMGDNRHNSIDARAWGYVPYNHVLGKPVFVWFSWNSNGKGFNKVRWDRVFSTVGGNGEPVSYFKFFLIALAGWFIFDFFRKRKKANS